MGERKKEEMNRDEEERVRKGVEMARGREGGSVPMRGGTTRRGEMKILRKRDKRKGGREKGKSKREIGSNNGRERENGYTAVLMQCPGD